jgi:hypothetical protein
VNEAKDDESGVYYSTSDLLDSTLIIHLAPQAGAIDQDRFLDEVESGDEQSGELRNLGFANGIESRVDNLVQGEYIRVMKNQQLTERLIVMVDKPTRKGLDKISNATGASVAYLVRRALTKYLEKIK